MVELKPEDMGAVINRLRRAQGQLGGVLGVDAVDRHLDAFQPLANRVIAQETLDADLSLLVEIGIAGIQAIQKPEVLGDCLLNLFIQE